MVDIQNISRQHLKTGNNDIEEIENNEIETIEEDPPEVINETETIEEPPTPISEDNDSINLNEFIGDDITIKQGDDNIDDLIKKKATSPTLERNDKRFFKEITNKKTDTTTEKTTKEKTSLEDLPKPIVKTNDKLEDTEIEFLSDLGVEGFDFLFDKSVQLMGYKADPTPSESKARFSRAFAKVLKKYNLKLSPIFMLIVVMLMVYGKKAAKTIKEENKIKPKTMTVVKSPAIKENETDTTDDKTNDNEMTTPTEIKKEAKIIDINNEQKPPVRSLADI